MLLQSFATRGHEYSGGYSTHVYPANSLDAAHSVVRRAKGGNLTERVFFQAACPENLVELGIKHATASTDRSFLCELAVSLCEGTWGTIDQLGPLLRLADEIVDRKDEEVWQEAMQTYSLLLNVMPAALVHIRVVDHPPSPVDDYGDLASEPLTRTAFEDWFGPVGRQRRRVLKLRRQPTQAVLRRVSGRNVEV